MNARLEVVCYVSKNLKDGTNPLLLRIAKDGKKKYLSLGVSLNRKYWDFKKQQPKSNCPNKEYLEKIILEKKSTYQNKIIEFTALNREYSPQTLTDAVEQPHMQRRVLSEMYEEQIAMLMRSGKIGNAQVYAYSKRSLEKFTRNKLAIPLEDITQEWLKKYEAYLLRNQCKGNTIGQLFRTLRSVYNKAVEAGFVKKEAYPFDKFKVSKFATETKKRAIPKEAIQKIVGLDLSDEPFYVRFSRDIFLFSYFGAGINFADIAHLRRCNVKAGRMCYVRQKTGKELSFKLTEQALSIVKRYYRGGEYIFPILNENVHKTPLQKDNRIHKILGKVNGNLKIIGQRVDVENLTTYVARHSFATVLKKSGVNINLISEALGHQDLKTTTIYLGKFDEEQVDQAMDYLL